MILFVFNIKLVLFVYCISMADMNDYVSYRDNDVLLYPHEIVFFLSCFFYIIGVVLSTVAFFTNVTVFTDNINDIVKLGYIISIILAYVIIIAIFFIGLYVFIWYRRRRSNIRVTY